MSQFKLYWEKLKQDKAVLFIAFLYLFLILYTLLVVMSTHLTYEEAYSYLFYSSKGIKHLFEVSAANNHVFNTLLTFWSTYFFPFNDFMLRLPSLLFLMLYLYLAYKIAVKQSRGRLLLFALLVLYWGLIPGIFYQARGFGIATTMVLAVIYFYFIEKKDPLLSLILLMIGTLIYPGMLPLLISFLVYLILFENSNFKSRPDMWAVSLLALFEIFYLAYFLQNILQPDRPIFGNAGFLQSEFATYVYNTFFAFGSMKAAKTSWVTYLFLLFLAGEGFLAYKTKNRDLIKAFFLFIGSLLITYLIAKLTKTPVAGGRLVIYLYPLFIWNVYLVIKALLPTSKNFSLWGKVLAGLLVINYLILMFMKGKEHHPENIFNLGYMNYKEEVFNKLNMHPQLPKGLKWDAAADYYVKKFLHNPDLTKIKAIKDKAECDLGNNVKVYYYPNNEFLYFEPLNNQALPEKIEVNFYVRTPDGKEKRNIILLETSPAKPAIIVTPRMPLKKIRIVNPETKDECVFEISEG